MFSARMLLHRYNEIRQYCFTIDLNMTALTSGALQTKVPASGSSLPDVVPYMFLIVISEMVKFACVKFISFDTISPAWLLPCLPDVLNTAFGSFAHSTA